MSEIVFFDNKSFFKNEEKVYIHLSTDFSEFVGVVHRHEFIEVVYVLSGSAVHTVGDKEYSVSCGDVVVINSGIPHKFTELKNDNESFVAYDLMFTPDFFDAKSINMEEFEALKNNFLFYSLFPENEKSLPDMHISKKKYSDYGEIFTKIYHEYQRKEKGYIELIRAYVIELIIKFFRDIEKNATNKITTENINLINQAVSYIEDNYNMKLYIDELAANVFLSPDYFRKLFKRVTGMNVSQFQQNIRIDNARKLLSTTALSIEEICFKVGYNDIKSFYQAFKKETKKTPQEYRMSQNS